MQTPVSIDDTADANTDKWTGRSQLEYGGQPHPVTLLIERTGEHFSSHTRLQSWQSMLTANRYRVSSPAFC